jgi:hypothetical protein
MLRTLQQQVARILTSDPWFGQAGVRVVAIDKGDALLVIEEVLARAGTAVLIAPPSGAFAAGSSAGPVSDDGGVRIVVQIVETSGLGRPQGLPNALDLAERAAWLLHSCNSPDRADDVPMGCKRVGAVPDPAGEALIIEVELVATAAIADPAATAAAEEE